jgi:hypothetical protein
VELTAQEVQIAALAAVIRTGTALTNALQHRYGYDGSNSWQVEVESSCAELAVCKALGVYWSGLEGPGARDVKGCEVRHTERDHGRLILHPSDPDDVPFVLVTGRRGSYDLRGWIYGIDGKKDIYWDDPTRKGRPAFFVPQHALNEWELSDDDRRRSDPQSDERNGQEGRQGEG